MVTIEKTRRLSYLEQFQPLLDDHHADSSSQAVRAITSQELDSLHETEKEETLEERVALLEKEIKGLKTHKQTRAKLSVADSVMKKLSGEFETESAGKIVAIDVESKEIVGVGESLTEAFRQAHGKTGKSKFDYRRVGSPYVHSLAH